MKKIFDKYMELMFPILHKVYFNTSDVDIKFTICYLISEYIVTELQYYDFETDWGEYIQLYGDNIGFIVYNKFSTINDKLDCFVFYVDYKDKEYEIRIRFYK